MFDRQRLVPGTMANWQPSCSLWHWAHRFGRSAAREDMHRTVSHPVMGATRSIRRRPAHPWLVAMMVAIMLVTWGRVASAQIGLRAAASATATTGNLTIAKPTGTVEDDVMIASIGVRPDTATITPPTG